MAKAHDRVVEIVFVADDSAETVIVSAVNYFRDRGAVAYPLKFTQTSPNTTGTELVFGELMPPPTHILLTFTVVP
jgi:hypothetical protein